MPSSRLILLDAHNLLYRAFYAIQELSTQDGRPTNALFGFIRGLRQVHRLWQPTHWAVVFDGGIPDRRRELLPEYKANRKTMPEALQAQMEPAGEYLDCAGIPSVRVPGEEADDVMASLAEIARSEGRDVLLVTADKDFMQLVSDEVAIVSPARMAERIGVDQVREKTGVEPGQVSDWLALTGDTSDNIPGVPGVGPKTAARLLREVAGSVAGLRESLDRVAPERLRETLRTHWDRVERNLRLVCLRRDVPGAGSVDSMEVREEDPGRLLPFYERYELGSLARELRQPELPL